MTDHSQRVHDTQRLLVLLGQLGQRVSSTLHASIGDALEFHNNEVVALIELDVQGPMRAGAIGAVTGLTTGGTTKLIDRLESAGMVTRQLAPAEDRRGVVVALTPRGRRCIRSAVLAVSEDLGDVEAMLRDTLEVFLAGQPE